MRTMMNRTNILLATLVLLVSFSLGIAEAADPDQAVKHVSLIIDYGDGTEKHFKTLAWREKMTVLDAMLQAAKHPRGIQFKHQGKGATVLLTQIDDLKNEGGGERNWIYRVNKELGDRSIGIYPLKAGDTILWKFEPYH